MNDVAAKLSRRRFLGPGGVVPAESRIPNLAGIKHTELATGPFQDILHFKGGKYEAL